MQPIPTVSQVYRLFAQEEKHKEISNLTNQTEAMAFYSERKSAGNYSQNQGFKKKQFSNAKDSNNPGQGQKTKPYYFCTNCNIAGHSIERCFKIHGFPPGFQAKQNKKVAAVAHQLSDNTEDTEQSSPISMAQYNQFLSMMDKSQNASIPHDVSNQSDSKFALLAGIVCLSSQSTSEWLIDSGATDHICPLLDKFQDFEAISGNNSFITGNNDIVLKRVLHVPDFHFSLISVRQLCTDMECQINFTNQGCFIQGLAMNRPPILLGNSCHGLYSTKSTMPTTFPTQLCTAAHLTKVQESKLWHVRMGHMPFQQLHLVTPVSSVKECLDTNICQVCPAAKQTRQPFPVSNIKTTAAFQLLHIDIWGPYKTKSITGCTQFLTIVDDFSRFT